MTIAENWAAITASSAKKHSERKVHPSSRAYFDLLDTLRELHSSKSADYGSETDPLANIRNGATFVGIPAWKAAMVRLSDKVTRLATFNRTGRLRHEGVEDSLLDLASYSLLALLLYREEHDKEQDDEPSASDK
jgi:hypothetical protein